MSLFTLLVAGFSTAARSITSRCNNSVCGDIDRGGQNSNCFEGRNDEEPEMAADSNEIEFRAVPAICLAPSYRWEPGPGAKLPLHRVFNYILQTLHLGCQWKELPIEKDPEGRREIHYTRIYSAFRRWQADGCFDAAFAGSVAMLHQANLLDATVIHGDGTTTAAKKGGDNIGFSGHKKVKGDKIVAFCDRNCNVIAPFVSAPGNRNELPLLREALPLVTRIAASVGLDLQGTIVSLDGVYDCQPNRKAIFNCGMIPNINANPRGRKKGSVANFSRGRMRGGRGLRCSRRKSVELLRRTQFARRSQLTLSDHVHELNAGEGRGGRPKGLEPHHRSHHTLDRSVVLFDDVVQVFPAGAQCPRRAPSCSSRSPRCWRRSCRW